MIKAKIKTPTKVVIAFKRSELPDIRSSPINTNTTGQKGVR